VFRDGGHAMIVKTILSGKGGNVVTIEPTTNVADAVNILVEKHIGALVVIGAEGRIVGIISERDIVRALAKRGNAALKLPLTEVMTRKVVTCSEDETLSVIMEQMTQGKFRHVPILDGDRLIGIISIGDVVKWRLEELQLEQNALRDYIATA
jgi:CBS domain-containing protein